MLASVDGWGINLARMDDAVAAIASAAERGESCAAFTLNLDHLVKLRTDARFRDAYRHARFVTADGAPVARLARRQGAAVERTTGADLVLPLMEAAAERDLPVYLFGSSPGVLGRAGARLAANTGYRLSIAGSEAPPMGFDPQSPSADAALDRVAASGARLCLLALGAPKQELLAARAVERGIPVVFVCIGAALDFLAGSQTRAPRVVQRSGMEWAWRLATNPRRLAGRYAQCALLLARLSLSHGNPQRNAAS
ncbi:MAG: WecB/TagA/CpsF family glycosyltransferase [Hyphomicrobiaceae bacterium]